jgi:hypothetical protein
LGIETKTYHGDTEKAFRRRFTRMGADRKEIGVGMTCQQISNGNSLQESWRFPAAASISAGMEPC